MVFSTERRAVLQRVRARGTSQRSDRVRPPRSQKANSKITFQNTDAEVARRVVRVTLQPLRPVLGTLRELDRVQHGRVGAVRAVAAAEQPKPACLPTRKYLDRCVSFLRHSVSLEGKSFLSLSDLVSRSMGPSEESHETALCVFKLSRSSFDWTERVQITVVANLAETRVRICISFSTRVTRSCTVRFGPSRDFQRTRDGLQFGFPEHSRSSQSLRPSHPRSSKTNGIFDGRKDAGRDASSEPPTIGATILAPFSSRLSFLLFFKDPLESEEKKKETVLFDEK